MKKVVQYIQSSHFWELLPLFLLVSSLPFLTDVTYPISKIVFFAFPMFYLPLLLSRTRKIPKSYNIIVSAWLLFLFVALVSLIGSSSIAYSILDFFELVGIFIYFLMFLLTIKDRRDLIFFAFSIFLVGILLSLLSLYFIFSPPTTVGIMNLFYASYGHNHLADYLMYVLPISIYFFFAQKERKLLILFGVILAFLFLSLYLTFSRTSFIVVPLISVLLVGKMKVSRRKAWFVLVLALIPLLLFIGILYSSITFTGRVESWRDSSIRSWIQRQTIKPLSKEGRFSYYNQAIQGFIYHPIFGSGPGTFRLVSQQFPMNDHFSWYAHSNPLQLLSELGFLGLLAYLYLLFVVFRGIKIGLNNSGFAALLLMGTLGSFLQSFMTFNFQFLAIQLLFFTGLAVLYKTSYEKTNLITILRMKILIIVLCVISFFFALSIAGSIMLTRHAKTIEAKQVEQAQKLYQYMLFMPSYNANRFYAYVQFISARQLAFGSHLFQQLTLLWNKRDPTFYYELARFYKTSRPDLASRYFQQAQELNPADVSTALSYASFLISQHEPDLAYEKLLTPVWYETTPYFSDEDKEKVKTYFMKDGNVLTEDELTFFSTDISLHKEWYYAKLFYSIGLSYFHNEDYAATLEFWTSATKLAPDWSLFYVELANLYTFLGNEQRATEILNACIELDWPRKHCEDYIFTSSKEGYKLPGSFQNDIRGL